MIEQLESYLHINAIDEPALLTAGSFLVDHPHAKTCLYSCWAYLLSGFHDYLQNELTQEEFFAVGTEYTSRRILPAPAQLVSAFVIDQYLKQGSQIVHDALVVMTQPAVQYYLHR